jgi:predicted dehydrogenase
MAKPLGIILVGAGYWGKNYARALTELGGVFDLRYIVDLNQALLDDFHAKYPRVACTKDLAAALADPAVSAAVVVTPASTHFAVGSAVLSARKHLLMEKPLTVDPGEADALVKMAADAGVRLMTGFTFLFVPAVMRARDIMRTPEFGVPYYFTSRRSNLGPVRRDVSVVWDLVPHDLAMFAAWVGKPAVSVSATGASFLAEKEDAVNVVVKYEGGAMGTIFASWAEPRKVREFVVVGSGKTLVVDDVDMMAPLKIHHKGVSKDSMFPSPDEFGSFKLVVQSGSLEVPELPLGEPLKNKLNHFAACVADPALECIAPGELGAEVTKLLWAIDASLKSGGAPIALRRPAAA